MTTTKFIKQTKSANLSTVEKKWLLIDADSVVLGRLATTVSNLLRGKHKPSYTPHVDCGDNVIIINASKINLTGNKWTDKEYISYTGYPGGQRIKTAQQLYDKNPSIIIEKAVKGMLPKNKLGAVIFKNLRVYNDELHKQESQSPESINLNNI